MTKHEERRKACLETARGKKGSSEVRMGTLNGGSMTGEGREQRKADTLCVERLGRKKQAQEHWRWI